jgi:hypothetical protein
LGNKTTYDEAKKWFNKRGPIIAESVSAMLNWTIDAETAFFMFKACAFEYSLDGTADRWCALFREEDFLVWEYYKDLKLFYESGSDLLGQYSLNDEGLTISRVYRLRRNWVRI